MVVTTPLELLRYRLKRWEVLRRRADDATDPTLAAVLRREHTTEPTAPGHARIQSRRQLTDDLLILRLERPAGFELVPGQHVTLALEGMTRKLTLCSAPHEPWLELFVERRPGGAFAPHLFALREGDAVGIADGASGSFALASGVSDHVMIATVTGIAPFVSMVRAARHAGSTDRFSILHGASYPDELGYAHELSAIPNVRYLPTVSRPDEARSSSWTGAVGRVGEHLEPYVAEHGLTPDSAVIYACGNPQMIEDVRARMGALGYRVRDESYD